MPKKGKKRAKKLVKKIIKKPVKKIQKSVPEIEKNSDQVKKTKIRVVSIGGGGGNIISELSQMVKKTTFYAANTDLKELREVSRRVERFSFGQSLTHGLGTGMNSELGETAALNEKERIKKLLQGQDLVILVGCLGGGTASGAAHVFAKISRDLGNLTYGIFTLPFKFEGERKMEIAKNALEKIKTKVNALSIIPNERIFQIINKATPLKQALSAINKNLSESLEGLIEIIYEPGLINIDFADLRAVLEGQGRLAYLNTVEVQRKEGSVEKAIEKVLNSPLYPYKIKGAKAVLFDIGGEKGLSLEEVSKISKTISEEANREAKIIFGISQGKKYSDRIRTTLLATGCGAKVFSSGKTRKVHKKKEVPKVEEKKPVKKRRKAKKPRKTPRNRKIKIEINKKPNEEIKAESSEPKKEAVLASFSLNKAELLSNKIRKNALQIKKEVEEEEAKMIEEEKIWETPAFLRQNKIL